MFFHTMTEIRDSLNALPADRHHEITYIIYERLTGHRAAVTLAGVRSEMLRQAQAVWNDGWGINRDEVLDFTRHNRDARRFVGMNRTSFGY